MIRQRLFSAFVSLAGVAVSSQMAMAIDWSSSVPPWRLPTALSRSTSPTSVPGPFNAYDPSYGSYPDPLQYRATLSAASAPGTYHYGQSAYSKYARNANRVVAGYHGGETYYYGGGSFGGESFGQPEAVVPAEPAPLPGGQVYPPVQTAPMPLEAVPLPGEMLPATPAPYGYPAPCSPECGAACPPPCPAAWQHRCGQRLGAMLTRMKNCCDDFCARLARCFECPKPQPCCWTGYTAPWHAPQSFGCASGGYPAFSGAFDDGSNGSIGVDVEQGFADADSYEGYETVVPDVAAPKVALPAATSGEVVEEGPVFYDYGRPASDVTVVETPTEDVAVPAVEPAAAAAQPQEESAGHVENPVKIELETPQADQVDAPIEVEAPELPRPSEIPSPVDDSVT